MSRYIDANTLKSEFEWLLSQVSEISKGEVREVITRIDNTPTANVAEVVHGKWIGKGEDVNCSECGCHPLKEMDMDCVYYWKYAPPYCPNCGADMREATNG